MKRVGAFIFYIAVVLLDVKKLHILEAITQTLLKSKDMYLRFENTIQIMSLECCAKALCVK